MVSGACPKPDVDSSVHQDTAEHADEDPEIMEPKALILVRIVDPALWGGLVGGNARACGETYPGGSSHVEVVGVEDWSEESH